MSFIFDLLGLPRRDPPIDVSQSLTTTRRTPAQIQEAITRFSTLSLDDFRDYTNVPSLPTLQELARGARPPQICAAQFQFDQKPDTWREQIGHESGLYPYIKDSAGLGAAVGLVNVYLDRTLLSGRLRVDHDGQLRATGGGGESDLRITVKSPTGAEEFVMMNVEVKRKKVFQRSLSTLVTRLCSGPIDLQSLSSKEKAVFTEVGPLIS